MSEKRSSPAFLIAMGVLLVVGSVFLLVILPNMLKPQTNLWLGDGVFRTKLALNDSDRAKGLSGVNELAPDQALLMAFPSEGKWGIWMKDMSIPIDIIWLNKDKKVIYIVKNVSPNNSTSEVYKPKILAKYVAELPAGTVDNKAIRTTSTAIFQLDMNEVN
jgi:hypothetical protein